MGPAEATSDPQHVRVFILSSGRSGSTLLAAILADAGADFGMQVPERWDPGTGDLEHAELHRMGRWMQYAYEVSPDRPGLGVGRCLWAFYRSMGKARLLRLLRAARYIKGEGADFAVLPAFKMGYFPTVVVSYRRFDEVAVSSGLMSGHSNLESLAKYYNRVYRNALLSLHIFGGCVVSHEQLTGAADTSWAVPLATATGLPADRLVSARNRRLKPSERFAIASSMDASTTETFSKLDAIRGLTIPPSAQALRSWAQKQAGADPQRGARRGRRWWVRPSIEASALAMALFDRRVPWYGRALAIVCILAYALAPVDPIPDRFPVVGHLDDVIVSAFAIWLFSRLVPASVIRELRSAAAARLGVSF